MSKIKTLCERHPRLVRWAVLAVGMVTMLLVAAHGRGLTMGQMTAMVIATIALAGACAWIISSD